MEKPLEDRDGNGMYNILEYPCEYSSMDIFIL